MEGYCFIKQSDAKKGSDDGKKNDGNCVMKVFQKTEGFPKMLYDAESSFCSVELTDANMVCYPGFEKKKVNGKTYC